MSGVRLRVVDAFTEHPGSGNPAGVVLLDPGDWPPEAWLRSIRVPPMIVAVVMMLQRVEGCGDREAVDRFAFVARWKYAAGGLDSTIRVSCTRCSRWPNPPVWSDASGSSCGHRQRAQWRGPLRGDLVR